MLDLSNNNFQTVKPRLSFAYLAFLLLFIGGVCAQAEPVATEKHSLVPKTVNTAPDYFCTWNIQGFLCSYASSEGQRAALDETNLFGSGKNQGWINFFPKVRSDLLFVMDDSWDVPLKEDKDYYGSLIISSDRFPTCTGTPGERLKNLTEKVKAAGWKGLGGWVCAQKATKFSEMDETAYWTERMKWMRDSGFAYWKVDWGKHAHDAAWRRMLTELGKKEAPDLVIEHALTTDTLPFAAVYRTYDVENVIAAADTIDRVGKILKENLSGSPTLINCEDEPYIAAGLGCVLGVMRHPFTGPLPDGRQDIVFPACGRDLKRRLDEVVRAVRWHRIATPLKAGDSAANIDTNILKDTWMLEKDETWTHHQPGDWRKASAPARISRGLELPEVAVGEAEVLPFVLATRSTNGAVAIATIGRTIGRQYINPKANVSVSVGSARGPFGVFGYYGSLTLRFDHDFGKPRVLAQDLAAEESTDITDLVKVEGNTLRIPGEVIERVGLSAATPNDLSEPGLVLMVE